MQKQSLIMLKKLEKPLGKQKKPALTIKLMEFGIQSFLPWIDQHALRHIINSRWRRYC